MTPAVAIERRDEAFALFQRCQRFVSAVEHAYKVFESCGLVTTACAKADLNFLIQQCDFYKELYMSYEDQCSDLAEEAA